MQTMLIVRQSRIALVSALLSACGGGEPSEELREPRGPLQRIEANGPESPANERGVGLVFLAGERRESASADTMPIYAEPEADAPVVARLLRDAEGVFGLDADSEATVGSAVAFDYETVGLPILSTLGESAPDQWMRVQYATTSAGEPLEGWVSNDPSRFETLRWATHLRDKPVFFISSDSIAFHETVDGPRVEIPLAAGDTQQPFDYIMHPLTVQGPWMRVEVVSPTNYCFDPSAPLRDTVWVRYLQDGGEPRVWYYTKGC